MSEPNPKLHSLTPHIVCAGAADAIEFYKKAFGATEIMRMPVPDGRLMHASLRIGDSVLMLVDEMPQWGALGPKARNGTSVTLHLNVPNVDEVFARAITCGATVKMPVTDMFWGDRYGVVIDPFGHEWSIATKIREMSVDEMIAAGRAAMSEQPCG